MPIGDANPDTGSLVALKQYLPDKYVASTDPPRESATSALQTAIRVLQGQGVKQSVIVANPPVVSGAATLDKWIDPSWKESDVATAPAPPGTEWLTQEQLNSFFTNPKELPPN